MQSSNITLRRAAPDDRVTWNHFVRTHTPPVGGFMESWEWGTFQESLGKKVERYFMVEDTETIACTLVVYQKLPFGYSYAYLPRGPVVAQEAIALGKLPLILGALETFAHTLPKSIIFLRIEPSIFPENLSVIPPRFVTPSYYVQPRHNHTIPLDVPADEIAKRFHPSTRSNIHRAENRGVTVVGDRLLSGDQFEAFFSMISDTIARNRGTNAYPSRTYFQKLIQLAAEAHATDPESLSIRIFSGFQNGEPAATHMVMFFGTTATYLFGAAYTHKLNSKVVTYLHVTAMKEAAKQGYLWYDLGGIDEVKWPAITEFKRQFHGKEFTYVGTIDIPTRPFLYRLYNVFRMIWK